MTREAARIMRELGVPLLIHQPSYSMLNRWIEEGLLDALVEEGMGCIAFSPLAQGVLTDKYLEGIPEDARINQPGGDSLQRSHLSEENLAHVDALNEIAKARGQTLAQMALAWTLRDPRVTSALIGASRPEQVIENVGALENLEFTPEELAAIDAHAQDGDLNLWKRPSQDERP
jgi:L-glyceraldehyde 3-phosphate reductase